MVLKIHYFPCKRKQGCYFAPYSRSVNIIGMEIIWQFIKIQNKTKTKENEIEKKQKQPY